MDITALAGLLRETEQRHGAFDSTAPCLLYTSPSPRD